MCETFLEHVSSYEHDDRPYCHLDYHEVIIAFLLPNLYLFPPFIDGVHLQLFAPRCYHCQTPIMEEHFITLDDEALGKRTYHEQHFFCAECGDPFLAPKQERRTRQLDNGTLESACLFFLMFFSALTSGLLVLDQEDEVGFTVYKGHPYCEACHVRLRMPKCKRCKKSIRPGDQAIEALGSKWCWSCFTCDVCVLFLSAVTWWRMLTSSICFLFSFSGARSHLRPLISMNMGRSRIVNGAMASSWSTS